MTNPRHTQDVTPTPESDVRAELDRILASKGFASAARVSRLLRYVVDKTLAGESDQLKEYSVGVEVFERDANYDPRLDSIVRVEAGRLRSKLDEYYNGDGASSPLRIALPRGGYAASFDRRIPASHNGAGAAVAAPLSVAQEPAPPRQSRISLVLAAALLIAVGGMIAWLVVWQRQRPADTRPTIAVLAFETNMIGGDETTPRYLTEAITTELTRLGTMNVASYSSAMRLQGQRLSSKEQSAALNSTYLIEGSIDDEGGLILVVPRIVNGVAERKLWVSDYRGDYSEVRSIAQHIAFDINAEISRIARTP